MALLTVGVPLVNEKLIAAAGRDEFALFKAFSVVT